VATRLDLFVLSSVLVPGASLRLHVFEERYKMMIGECIERDAPFGVVLDRGGREVGDDLDPSTVGTAAQIREVTQLSEGRLFIDTQGIRRFRVERFIRTKPFWTAEVSYLDERVGPVETAMRIRATASERFRDYLQALLRLSGREIEVVQLPEDPAASSFLIADALQIDAAAKQTLLEAPSAAERLVAELRILDDEIRRLRARGEDENPHGDDDRRRRLLKVRISLN